MDLADNDADASGNSDPAAVQRPPLPPGFIGDVVGVTASGGGSAEAGVSVSR